MSRRTSSDMPSLRRVALLTLSFFLAVDAPLFTAGSPLTEFQSPPMIRYPAAQAFNHATGAGSRYGWQADFRIHSPGYLIDGLPDGGTALPEGTYRYDFYFALRSGFLRHLLSAANDVVRVEVWDSTTSENLMDRTFQRADFPSMGKTLTRKSLTFSTWGRPGHRFQPKVYWHGLSGVFVSRIDVHQLDSVSLQTLTDKSQSLESTMPMFLDRGYVVVRSVDGRAEDIGDAAIWTGLYVAAEAWRYQTMGDDAARTRMETSLWALHRLRAESPTPGTLVRYIDADGVPLPEAPSKDTYTGFFFGIAQGLPWVRDAALRSALIEDVDAVAGNLVDHDLRLASSTGSVDFNPSFSPAFLGTLLAHLRDHPSEARHARRLLSILRWYFRLTGQKPAPFLSRLDHAIQHPDQALALSELDVLNGLLQMLRQLEHNVHHSAVTGNRSRWPGTPYGKLDLILLRALNNLDSQTSGGPIERLDQVKVLPSEALHALHLVKIAARVLPQPNRYETFYANNLWREKSLLSTAVQWSQIDEDLAGAAFGETYADATRTGSSHLTFLALYDLFTLEADPALKVQYETIFERQEAPMRSDYNAMLQVMEERIGWRPRQLGLALWSLERYPMDRRGLGDAYWAEHREEWTNAFGGEVAGKAREPIPVDLRPRDAFLWQRSARSIRGDHADWIYPPVDYLFAYWMARSSTEPRRVILDVNPLQIRPTSDDE